jgi:Domain of unknown function (DUF1330)
LKSPDICWLSAKRQTGQKLLHTQRRFHPFMPVLTRGVTWLEGPWQDRSVILATFPTRAQVDAFWWSEAYRQAIRKRDNAGVFSVIAFEGRSQLSTNAPMGSFLIVMTARRDASASQTHLSSQAALSLEQGVTASGGVLVTAQDSTKFTPMEGDSVFDRITVAAWETTAARDAYLASRQARVTSQLRARLGLSAVATANGLPRAPAAVLVSPPSTQTPAALK